MNGPTSSRPLALHRYTGIENVIQMLKSREIMLRSPSHWADRNDAFALNLYRQRIGAGSILAACFTQASETYHHWKVFAPTGACVEFDRQRFLDAFKNRDDIKSGRVMYREIRKLEQKPPSQNQLPFLKRYPYRDELEYRMIYADLATDLQQRSFPFPFDSIRRITLSPWLSVEALEDEKRNIKNINGCSRLKVYRTTVLDNKAWKKALESSRALEKR